MSNRALDSALAHESYVGEVACCDCGYHRHGAHHPKIQCPRTGRCGSCGNDWPCEEHAPPRACSVVGCDVPAWRNCAGCARPFCAHELRRVVGYLGRFCEGCREGHDWSSGAPKP